MAARNVIYTRTYHSPCGVLLIGANAGNRLCLCDWLTDTSRRTAHARLLRTMDAEYVPDASHPTVCAAARQLDEYFEGVRTDFDIPLAFADTLFRRRVWESLLDIPFGTTVTYAYIASALGIPKAVRAVASAIGANPISVFVPCHRVIGSDNSLRGYAGGLHAKRCLLDLEAGRVAVRT